MKGAYAKALLCRERATAVEKCFPSRFAKRWTDARGPRVIDATDIDGRIMNVTKHCRAMTLSCKFVASFLVFSSLISASYERDDKW